MHIKLFENIGYINVVGIFNSLKASESGKWPRWYFVIRTESSTINETAQVEDSFLHLTLYVGVGGVCECVQMYKMSDCVVC